MIGTMPVTMTDIAFNSQGELYGVDSELFGGDLYRIDPLTAAATDIGPLGCSVNALVFGPDGTLFGAERRPVHDRHKHSGCNWSQLSGYSSAGDLAFDTGRKLVSDNDTRYPG